MSEKPEPKKRGRKKKSETEVVEQVHVEVPSANDDAQTAVEVDMPKKRGRKPKGGKIIPVAKPTTSVIEKSKNVILHLKCYLNDLNENAHETSITGYNAMNNEFELLNNNVVNHSSLNDISYKESDILTTNFEQPPLSVSNEVVKEEVLHKINQLKLNLSKNNISDKRSACFWCTYEFHNPPIFIPKREKSDGYEVYGCFCTPECGVAYLMNEMIDSSIKFERYQLMNYIYGKSLNYDSNIKPAPNPHYLLDKYYGNLSIEEYRSTLHNNNYLIFVEKPLTHVFPEMFNDNIDFTLMKDGANNNSLSQFKIKKASENAKKLKTKSEIVKEKFGVV